MKWASPRWSSASAKLPTLKRIRMITLFLGVPFLSSAYFIPLGRTPKMMLGSTAKSLAAKFQARAASVWGLTRAVAAAESRARTGTEAPAAAIRRIGASAAAVRRRKKDVMQKGSGDVGAWGQAGP